MHENLAIQGPIWHYHYHVEEAKRPRGPTLRLLSFSELKEVKIKALLDKYITDFRQHKTNHAEYSYLFQSKPSKTTALICQYQAHYRQLAKTKCYQTERDEISVIAINETLNQIFSNLGWRLMRKRISQISKQESRSRVLISQHIHQQLKQLKYELGVNSLDETLEELIIHFKESS